jgi:geranylgeranyl diphosphate synthase type II
MSLDTLDRWASPLRARVDAWMLARFADAWPPRFQEACRYPLLTGGKRIRPLLGYAAAEAVGAPVDDRVLGALGCLELVHGYSLVHDDLPCMDDDDERRGRPTVHRAYTDGTAVLVGDAMLTAAFGGLAALDAPGDVRAALVSELARAAGHVGMIAGQAADIGLGGPVTDVDQLVRLHRAKTGALIRGAVRMGGIAAGADDQQLAALTTYGAAIGLAFQLADDVLDADEDAGVDGPPSYVKLLGVDETRARARAFMDEALAAVADLPAPERLVDLARFTVERDH